jgi:hypothetical protein
LEILIRLDTIGRNIDKALHRSTREIHLAGMGLKESLLILTWADANHEFLSDYADAHVTLEKKDKAAKHLLLGHVGMIFQRLTNSLGETFVVRHVGPCRLTDWAFSRRRALAARAETLRTAEYYQRIKSATRKPVGCNALLDGGQATRGSA